MLQETYKFPYGGYDVKIVRKQDILRTIEENIKDKDVALAVVKHCEIACAKFLTEGKMAVIPYIGNIRIPIFKKKWLETYGSRILKDARDKMNEGEYIMFKKNLNDKISKELAEEQLYRYDVKVSVNKNKDIYELIYNIKGREFANLLVGSLKEAVDASSNVEYYE